MPSLFPQSINSDQINIESIEESLEFKGSYLFDFEKGEFITNPDGSIAKCDDLQAYIQWCNKAMLSPRYKLAYGDLYGQEFKSIIGSGLSRKAIELEIKRMTIETLVVHPRTRDATNFVFQWSESKEEVYYEYEVITRDEERFVLNNTVKAG